MRNGRWEAVRQELRDAPRTWLVTGAAGFIGSHLVEELLGLGQLVRGLDDLSTGSSANLEDVRRRVGTEAWARFRFLRADVRDSEVCRRACEGSPVVLHQAALGSVPFSLAHPAASHDVNVTGFLRLMTSAREARCPRFVFASSSSVYGDRGSLPNEEDALGEPLSPYAATKRIGEICAETFAGAFGFETVGLRYFNVFGPRQNPRGPYKAVMPRWIEALLGGAAPRIHGNGDTTRDFCPVGNVVQANLLAALAPPEACGRAYNVGLGLSTSLLELLELLRERLARMGFDCGEVAPVHEAYRGGDVRHSAADLARVRRALGYAPHVGLGAGIDRTLAWFLAESSAA